MKLIAHRANINGHSSEENSPQQVDKCIELGYDIEIDIRYNPVTEIFWLGHDEPQYNVSFEWISTRQSFLWIHCKDLITLNKFTETDCQYFWHQEDDFTLTSNNYIWTLPGKPYMEKSIVVMPEKIMDIKKLIDLKTINCHGICSDYVSQLK